MDYNNNQYNNVPTGNNPVGQQGVPNQAPAYNGIPSTPQPVMAGSQNNMGVNNAPKKGKGKVIGICVAVVAVIGLVVGGIFGYKKLTDNPTKILKNSINDLYANFSESLKEYGENPLVNAFLNDTVTISGDLSLEGSLFETIKDDKLAFSLGMDAKNERMEMYAALSEKNKTLVDATIYAKDGKAYMTSKTLFDNMYEVGDTVASLSFSLGDLQAEADKMPSISELDAIVKDFKDALVNSLDEKELTKDKTEIKINGETLKVNRLSYNVDEESIKNLFSSTFKELQGNSNFVKNLAKVFGMTEDEIKEGLGEAAKPEYYESEDGEEEFKGKFILYTTGMKNKVVGMELADGDGNLHYYNNEGNFNIRFELDKETVFEIVGKKEKDATKVTLKTADESNEGKLTEVLTLTVRQFNEEGIDLDYDLNSFKGSLKITEKKVNDKKYEGVMEFSIDVEDAGDMKVKMNYTAEIGTKVADIDTSKALPKEQITTQDTLKMNQAMTNLESSALVTFISQIMETMTPTVTDTDDCYDNYLDAYLDDTFSGTYEEYSKTYCSSSSM